MALKQGDKIGILGGGQLAQLLINAANKLEFPAFGFPIIPTSAITFNL